MKKINVAIDGTSGVGKSTISDLLAQKYNLLHLDTGAMYRCVAYYMHIYQIHYENENELKEALNQIQIRFSGKKVYLNGEDVSNEIRSNDVSMLTSKISTYALVRKKMVSLQQDICKEKGYIVDGRDICSTVLPDAEVKIYMSATSEARAQRRYKEYCDKRIEANYDVILKDIIQRDFQDSHRAISPLKKAEDAIEVDTSNLSIEEVIEVLSKLIEEKL
ncbi:(d)CMP kinase [Floccifex sp.]|uniref:(d)CMP kinase n=1 Tax=Floccifex sp. TaxID=2815810 RepID=UPI003F126F20